MVNSLEGVILICFSLYLLSWASFFLWNFHYKRIRCMFNCERGHYQILISSLVAVFVLFWGKYEELLRKYRSNLVGTIDFRQSLSGFFQMKQFVCWNAKTIIKWSFWHSFCVCDSGLGAMQDMCLKRNHKVILIGTLV